VLTRIVFFVAILQALLSLAFPDGAGIRVMAVAVACFAAVLAAIEAGRAGRYLYRVGRVAQPCPASGLVHDRRGLVDEGELRRAYRLDGRAGAYGPEPVRRAIGAVTRGGSKPITQPRVQRPHSPHRRNSRRGSRAR
jgi:hypothetical protein